MQTDNRKRRCLDPQVVARLSAIPLLARKPMLGQVSGRHASPHRGASVEFAEYRKYVPGDDLRRLDWRAYGRSDRFYVKEFDADTNLRCCLVVDTSGSMEFGSTGMTKLDYARHLAATMAYLAVQQGDAVGLACFSSNIVKNLPPKRNPAHLSVLLDELDAIQAKGQTQLVKVLHELAETIRQRALVVICSDLFVPAAELKSCFEHLRFRKHDVAVFHLLDPEELQFQFHRPTRFVDMEGGTSLFVEPVEIADRYMRALQTYLDELKQVMLESGADYQRISIDQPYEEVLSKLLIGRARSRGQR
jgi:uncharacterized protein (DUF58 family)